MHSSPCSPGWKQSGPAQSPQQKPSVKPGPAQPSISECGGNLYRRGFCYAKQAARMRSSPYSSGWKQFTPDQAPAAEAVGQGWPGARQWQGWRPLGRLQQEAIYVALVPSMQEAV